MNNPLSHHNNQTPFNIFTLNFSKSHHHSPKNIYHIIFLQQTSNILVIDTQKTYTIYRIISQTQTTVQSQGRFQHQLADNFEELFIDGRSLILYSVQDAIYLHDVKRNRKVDSIQFKEYKYGHSSMYEEEYKFRLVSLIDSKKNYISQEIPYVLLFWKLSALYKSGNRQLLIELRVLSFGFKVNQVLVQKLALISQFQDINPNMMREVNFQPHKNFPKPIKLESQHYLDFTFAFDHPMSYQIEGYHLQFVILSSVGETKRKFTINSIYNQLVKEVIVVKSSKLLILTKHESMNLEELQREQEDEILHHENNHHHIAQTYEEHLNNAQHQLFKEDFDFDIHETKDNNKLLKQTYNHLFEFSTQTSSKSLQQEQRIDIYCIELQRNIKEENHQLEEQTQQMKTNHIKLQEIKLTKLYSSLLIKQISTALSLTPAVIDNIGELYKNTILQRLQGDEKDIKACNDLSQIKESVQEIYYENVFTSEQSHLSRIKGGDIPECQLMKVKYSKSVLYIKMIEQLLGKSIDQKGKIKALEKDSSKTSIEPRNQSQLNLNQNHDVNQSLAHNKPTTNQQSTQFSQLILSMLIR